MTDAEQALLLVCLAEVVAVGVLVWILGRPDRYSRRHVRVNWNRHHE